MVRDLPTGYARDVYMHYRNNKRSVTDALAAAARVEACPDESVCASCGKPLEARDAVRLRPSTGELWCEGCVQEERRR